MLKHLLGLDIVDELLDDLLLRLLKRLPVKVWVVLYLTSSRRGLPELRWCWRVRLRSGGSSRAFSEGIWGCRRVYSSRSRCDAGNWLSWERVVFAWNWCSHGNVGAVPVRGIVFCHPVRRSLSQALGILVDDRPLVIVGFRVVHQPLAVALYLCEVRVFAAFKFVLRTLSAEARTTLSEHRRYRRPTARVAGLWGSSLVQRAERGMSRGNSTGRRECVVVPRWFQLQSGA